MIPIPSYPYRVAVSYKGDDSKSGDILEGAAAIAEFLFGDAGRSRKVYYLAETGQLPTFRMGGLCARKSTLKTWLREKEAVVLNSAWSARGAG